MKECKKCKVMKTKDNFNKHRTTRDGLQPYCKSCIKEMNRIQDAQARAELPQALERLRSVYGDRTNKDLAIAYVCESKSWDEVFASRVVKQDNCLIWQLSTINGGYGQIMITTDSPRAKLGNVLPHRLSYALANGFEALPPGMTGPKSDTLVIDHTCNNKLCVNPEHLQVVTQAQNIAYKKERAA